MDPAPAFSVKGGAALGVAGVYAGQNISGPLPLMHVHYVFRRPASPPPPIEDVLDLLEVADRYHGGSADRLLLCMESGTPSRDTARAMSEENVEVVRRYYAAWNAGGLDAARVFWSDDFQWHDAPGMPDSGVYQGPDAVAAHFQDLADVLGGMKVHLDELVPAGDEVFVRLRVNLDAPRGGLLLSGPIFETVRIEHGQLRRIRLFLDERDALEAAGLQK
jgi:ketosteroid isomerase-like protein